MAPRKLQAEVGRGLLNLLVDKAELSYDRERKSNVDFPRTKENSEAS
jgi:hypothetical protein